MRKSLNPTDSHWRYRPNELPALALQRNTTRLGSLLKGVARPRLCEGVKSAMDFCPSEVQTKEASMETTPVVRVLPPVCNLNNVSGFGRRKKQSQSPQSKVTVNLAFRRGGYSRGHNPYFFPRSLRHSPSDSRTYAALSAGNPSAIHSFSPGLGKGVRGEVRLKWLVQPLSENLRKRNRERGGGCQSPGRLGG